MEKSTEKKQKKEKEKKVYFSPEIDSRIEGFALVFTFVVAGLILQFFPTYFGNEVVTQIAKWIFIVIGIMGLASELGKQKNQLIGLDNLAYGLLFIGGWLALFVFVKHWIANTASFILLILGLYAISLGAQQIVHTLLLHNKNKEDGSLNKETTKGDILLFLTKLLGVVLVAFQICKAVIDIKWPQG